MTWTSRVPALLQDGVLLLPNLLIDCRALYFGVFFNPTVSGMLNLLPNTHAAGLKAVRAVPVLSNAAMSCLVCQTTVTLLVSSALVTS